MKKKRDLFPISGGKTMVILSFKKMKLTLIFIFFVFFGF